MRSIEVLIGTTRHLSLVEFMRTGDSFGICIELQRWPSLETFNEFLQCGMDDVGGETMQWRPFQIDSDEYFEARRELSPHGTIDDLGLVAGNWAGWFEAAAVLLRPG